MRSDYALYAVAIIFFIITGIVALTLTELERNLWVVTTTILGLFFIVLGYSQRPRLKAAAIEAPSPVPSPAPASVTEAVEEKKPEILAEGPPLKVELTEVKGIGVKRAEQLKTLGITNVEDLARASAEDLAEKLKISPKITGKWVENAKELTKKA